MADFTRYFEKNTYWSYKHLLLQIDPLNSSCSQKLQYPKTKLKLKYVLRKSSSLEKVALPKVTLARANVFDWSSKQFTIFNE